MEGSHGKLGTGLADTLSCNNPHRFSNLDQSSGCQVPAVALTAGASAGLAGKYAADADLFDPQLLNHFGFFFGDIGPGFHDRLVGNNINDIIQSNPSDNPVFKANHNLVAFNNRRNRNPVQSSAIDIGHNNFLRHVNQTAGQITCVSSL